MDSLIFLSYLLFNNTEYAEMMYSGFRLGFRLFFGPVQKSDAGWNCLSLQKVFAYPEIS